MTDYLPSGRELEALKVLWQRERATVREICDEIGRGGDELAYTTVLSLLQVMEQKGLVGHKRDGKAYTYFPRVKRTDTFRDLAGTFLNKVFDGALDEYLVHAFHARDISEAEFKRLEKLIADAKKRTRGDRRKGSDR